MLDVKKVIESLKINPKEIVALEEEVKKSSYNLSPEVAKKLHVKFWAMSATVSEWLTKSKRLELEKKSGAERVLMALKTESEEKSEAAKDRFAKDNPMYHKAIDEYNTATLVREHLQMKKMDLNQAHYMCKEILQDFRAEKQGTPKDNGAF